MKSKKKNKSYNVLSDARIYYVIALIIIFIWTPQDVIRGKNRYFDGYYWTWLSDSSGQINLIYLGFEFIIITTVFILFRKK
jgi:hypothetical protein